MSFPAPDNGTHLPNVDPEVVAEMERENLPEGKTVVLCNVHDRHHVDLDDVDGIAEALLRQGDNIDENKCPLSFLTKGE